LSQGLKRVPAFKTIYYTFGSFEGRAET